MEEIDLNIFQEIFLFYSEDTGYNANVWLLLLLSIMLVIIYNWKYGKGNESFFDNFGSVIVSFIVVGLFTFFVLDVKGLNQERETLLKEKETKMDEYRKNYIEESYLNLVSGKEDKKNARLVNEVAEYFIYNNSDAIEKIENIYDSSNFRLSFLLMKTLEKGNSRIFKDQQKSEYYKDLFVSEICPNNKCNKSKVEQLKDDDIQYILSNRTIFNIESRISFFENTQFKCEAAKEGYNISKEFGNKLAKRYNCTYLYNSIN